MTTATTGAVVVLAVGIYAGANTSDRPGTPSPTSSTDSQPTSPAQTAAADTPSPPVSPPSTAAAEGLAPAVEQIAGVPHHRR